MPSAKGPKNFFGPWTRSGSNGNIVVPSPLINHNSNIYPKTAPSSPAYRSPFNSPASNSPPYMGPSQIAHHSQLKRHFSSTFMLIPEDREIEEISDCRSTGSERSTHVYAKEKYPVSTFHIIMRLMLWWPLLVIGIFQRFINFMMQSVWSFESTPSFWFSAFLWLFWKLISYPLAIIKSVLIFLHTPAHERLRKKRTVLISGGSTLQALHLARNFHSTGARVVVFEFEGLFALAKFSTAVDKFYTIPKMSQKNSDEYINALVDIVEKEKPNLYIPVGATSPAYFDSLAKPHMELAGCQKVFSPGAQEVSVLDDIGQILRKCESRNIPVPPYRVITSKSDLVRLYDAGWTDNFRNILLETGINGIIDRQKIILPSNKRDLKLSFEISEENPWIVLRDVPGKHYVTCTTVKDGKMIANVTCAIQTQTRNLIPEQNADIEKWLSEWFDKVNFKRPINGHISFRFVKSDASGNLLTLGARVGVTLSYLCYTGVQPRVVAKPCPHFDRRNSGPISQSRYWLPETVMNTIKNPSTKSLEHFIGTVLDKREALFAYNDPLPYVAYYHFQLPLQKVLKFLKRHSIKHRNSRI